MVVSDVVDKSFDNRINLYRLFLKDLRACNDNLVLEIDLLENGGVQGNGSPIHDCSGLICGYKSITGSEFYYD